MENFLALPVSCEAPSIHPKGLRPYGRVKAPANRRPPPALPYALKTKIFVIEQDRAVRETIGAVFGKNGYSGEFFETCPAVLSAHRLVSQGCILIDDEAFVTSGFGLRAWLKINAPGFTIIVMAGHPTLAKAVQAMRAGAGDFIGKAFIHDELLASIRRAVRPENDPAGKEKIRTLASGRVATLTARQHQIMDLIVAGHPSKNIAADLHISQRTVENHRASIARKTGSKSLANVIQTALCADCIFCRDDPEPRPPALDH